MISTMMSAMRTFPVLWLVLLFTAGGALAQQSDELDALNLADKVQAESKPEKKPDGKPEKKPADPGDWRGFVEVAVGQALLRNVVAPGAPDAKEQNQRLSIDLSIDKSFSPGWRVLLSDRLDLNWQGQGPSRSEVNTLKEAYLSWQVQGNQLLDAGRVNVYHGVATGYNPSDFFRVGAVRSLVSVDPGSLKKNRLGSVMLRGQQVWDGGSFVALYSPKLAQRPNSASFNPDLGATNSEGRYLLTFSQQLSPGFAPQWLLYGKEHQAPQLGLNMTGLLNDATVAYLEWSGGRSRSLLAQAFNGPDDSVFRNRLASGITFTTAGKLTLTLEYEYSGAGMDTASWNRFRQGSGLAMLRYRVLQQFSQELATKQELFFSANWQDAGISRLDISVLSKLNLADRSRLSWMEARYRMDQADLALQIQRNTGQASSVYGAFAQKWAWQALLRYYF